MYGNVWIGECQFGYLGISGGHECVVSVWL